MILCKIKDKKDFIGKLLASDCFDSFLVKEASIHTFIPFHFEGRINKSFFDPEDDSAASYLTYEYAQWKDVRPICFDLIKGKRTPTRFQFVLYLKPEALTAMFEKSELSATDFPVQNLIFNIRFEQSDMTITTAVDYSGFTLDKQAEQLWDKTALKFLEKKGILTE